MHGLGQRAFGENYVQEAEAKMEALSGLKGLEWHLIGPLQSNKTGMAAGRFDWVHTIDRVRISERISAARPPSIPPQNDCEQENNSGEATKSGFAPDVDAGSCYRGLGWERRCDGGRAKSMWQIQVGGAEGVEDFAVD